MVSLKKKKQEVVILIDHTKIKLTFRVEDAYMLPENGHTLSLLQGIIDYNYLEIIVRILFQVSKTQYSSSTDASKI